VLDELIAANIEPWVTLYHWDLPAALNDKTSTGGWLNPDIQDKFNDYADFCFKTFGAKVKKWITFNEPQSFCWIGYGIGIHAPGRCSPYMGDHCLKDGGGGNTSTEPYITSHNVILSHAKAAKTYRTKY
jgi:beta-glucosidase/6-phospho-beta-glucosidase/beta-galactosidase